MKLTNLFKSLSDEKQKEIVDKLEKRVKQKEIKSIQKLINLKFAEVTTIKGDRGEEGEPGKDGKPGKDGRAGKDGKKGKDGKAGKDGKTPIKGKDYYTPTEREQIIIQVRNFLIPQISKLDQRLEETVSELSSAIVANKQTPEEIRNALQILKGEDRLDVSSIKGIDKLIGGMRIFSGGGSGGGVGTITSIIAGTGLTGGGSSGAVTISLDTTYTDGVYLQQSNNLSDVANTNTALNTLLPSQGSNSGKFLTTDGTDTSWITVSGAPGGSNTQVQFNDSSAFGGDAGLVFNKTTDTLSIIGSSDSERLIVKAYSSQTDNIVEFQTSAGVIMSKITSAGFLSIDGAVSSALEAISITNNTGTTKRMLFGTRGQFTVNYSELSTGFAAALPPQNTAFSIGNSYDLGSDPGRDIVGGTVTVRKAQKSNNGTYSLNVVTEINSTTAMGTDNGLNTGARYFSQNIGSSIVSNLYGAYMHGRHATTGTSSSIVALQTIVDSYAAGAFTTGIGLRVGTIGSGTGTKPTNVYGIYVSNQDQGVTLNYALYTEGGAIVLNDTGGDFNIRVEGDTATNLIFVDAGLDAFQIGTTTAGVIADFRSTIIVFNEDGADRDFRVEGDTDTVLLVSDASADTVQVGSATTADSAKFYVLGKISTSGEMEINGDLNHDGTNIGFFGIAPTTRQTELTDELTAITSSAPGTPDYVIQDLVTVTGYGFVTLDEALTVLTVISNLQTRVNELETKLTAYGLLQDAD